MSKIISWNVNGIRSVLRKDLWYPFVSEYTPDIICLQEVRADKNQFSFNDQFNENYPFQFFNTHQSKKGYSGTAIFSKIEPISVSTPEFDIEGRILVAEYSDYVVVNVYVPNSGSLPLENDPSKGKRFDYRVKEWDQLFKNFLLSIDKKVIIGGDFNIAHKPIDIHNPKIKNTAGVTLEERENFEELLKIFVDSFRKKNPQTCKFSWWSNMHQCRLKNHGWRIDYFLLSKSLKFKDSDILEHVLGSDHAPILLTLL